MKTRITLPENGRNEKRRVTITAEFGKERMTIEVIVAAEFDENEMRKLAMARARDFCPQVRARCSLVGQSLRSDESSSRISNVSSIALRRRSGGERAFTIGTKESAARGEPAEPTGTVRVRRVHGLRIDLFTALRASKNLMLQRSIPALVHETRGPRARLKSPAPIVGHPWVACGAIGGPGRPARGSAQHGSLDPRPSCR
jgi:hypothetical protein